MQIKNILSRRVLLLLSIFIISCYGSKTTDSGSDGADDSNESTQESAQPEAVEIEETEESDEGDEGDDEEAESREDADSTLEPNEEQTPPEENTTGAIKK